MQAANSTWHGILSTLPGVSAVTDPFLRKKTSHDIDIGTYRQSLQRFGANVHTACEGRPAGIIAALFRGSLIAVQVSPMHIYRCLDRDQISPEQGSDDASWSPFGRDVDDCPETSQRLAIRSNVNIAGGLFRRKGFVTVATPVMSTTFRAEYCLPPAQQGGYYFTAATTSAGDNLWACICIHVRQYCLYVAIKGQVQTVFWAAQTKRKQCEHTKISCVVFASLVRPSWGQKPSHFRARKWTLLILSFFQHSPFFLPDLSAP